MIHIWMSSAFAIATFASAAFAEERTVEIAVSELTCPSCSFIVASSMRGVPSVKIDNFVEGPEAGHRVYRVTFNDAETSVEDIIRAVDANGYPAEVVPEVPS